MNSIDNQLSKRGKDIIGHIIMQQINQNQYKRILQTYLMQNQPIRLGIQYCLEFYQKFKQRQTIINRFGEYSAKEISKLFLKEKLKNIQKHFDQMPDKSCKIQHFLLILIMTMDIKFQQIPKYLIGFTSIFKQIKNHSNKVTYDDFFKYIVGQVANLQEDQQNTQFQVQFEQYKKQDYLLHDGGIKKIYFAKDLKIFIVLDQNSQLLKIYNLQMKIISRYQPSKQKHNNSTTKIKYFDFNQFSNKIGLVLSDKTFELINLQNFLNTKSRQLFQSTYLNYQVFSTQQQGSIKHLQFVQMTNKWLGLSEQNRLYLYHPQKMKDSNDQFVKEIVLWTDQKDEKKITDIVEIVQLSLICVVAENVVYFFNQNMSQKKWKHYVHGSNIRKMRYCEQKNTFYILAQQKCLTLLTVQRNSHAFKLSSYHLDHIVKDFQVFPYFQTILFSDLEHNIYLYDLRSVFCYKTSSYSHIIKRNMSYIKILKTSKSEFCIYGSYMILLSQQKLAIQKQIQYSINPSAHFDTQKQQLYISINNQILRLNLLNSQLIKICNNQNYQMNKYLHYLIDQNNQILVLDTDMNLYYIQLKKQKSKQKISAFKHVDIEVALDMVYNKQTNNVYIMGGDQLYEIKNINKNLNISRQLLFHNLDQIVSTNFLIKQNMLAFTTFTNIFYLLDLVEFNILHKIQLSFQKDKNILEKVVILVSYYLAEYDVLAILTNNNKLLLISINNLQMYGFINLLECVSYQQVDIDFKFVKMVLSQNLSARTAGNSKSKKTYNTKVYLTTIDGHFLQINIQPFIQQMLKDAVSSEKTVVQNLKSNDSSLNKAIQTNKNKYLLNLNLIQTKKINLKFQKTFKTNRKLFIFQRRHQKQIMITKSILIQKQLTLTISKEGQISLFQQQNNISTLLLPNLKEKYKNTAQIQKIKIQKIQKQIVSILNRIKSLWQTKQTPKQLIKKIKLDKQINSQLTKFNHKQPISIQIEKKNIEEIVNNQSYCKVIEDSFLANHMNKNNIHTNNNRTSINFRTQKSFRSSKNQIFNKRANLSYSHSWRQNKQFKKIYQSHSPEQNKYNNKKIPKQLLNLRHSLDMIPKKSKLNQINPQIQQKTLSLIPQLKLYKFQQKSLKPSYLQAQNEKSQIFYNAKQDFQSCYYIKNTNKNVKKSNANEFDDIDKEFYKKQINFGKKFINSSFAAKNANKEESGGTFGLARKQRFASSRGNSLNRYKQNQTVLDYNVAPFRTNPISSILQLFQKHNRQVSGTKYGRQINIGKQIRQLKYKNFHQKY